MAWFIQDGKTEQAFIFTAPRCLRVGICRVTGVEGGGGGRLRYILGDVHD